MFVLIFVPSDFIYSLPWLISSTNCICLRLCSFEAQPAYIVCWLTSIQENCSMFTSCYVSGTSCLCVTLTQHTDHGMYLQNTDDLLAQYSRLLLHVIDLLPTSYVTLDNHCLPLCLSNIHKMTRDDSLDFFFGFKFGILHVRNSPHCPVKVRLCLWKEGIYN